MTLRFSPVPLILAAAVLVLAPAPAAMAQTGRSGESRSAAEAEVVALLQGLGYTILTEERTWLGRARIVAEKDGMRREVVFNPGTGEILRDYAFAPPIDTKRDVADASTPALVADPPVTGTATAGVIAVGTPAADVDVSLSEPLGAIAPAASPGQ